MRRRFQISLAGIAVIGGAALLFASMGGPQGLVGTICLVLVGLGVGSAGIGAARRLVEEFAPKRLLLSPDAETALQSLALRRGAGVSGAAVTTKIVESRDAAVLNTLFGRFDEARACLASVDWTAAPTLTRVSELCAEALLDLLDTHDYARARNILKRAERAASESSAQMPDADRSELYALVVASELLLGELLPVTVEHSELAARSEHALAKLISNWALGVHWWREEERDRANVHFEVCRKLAPHCELLHRAPPTPPRKALAQ